MKKIIFSIVLLLGSAAPAYAIDSLYLGGELGFVGLSSNTYTSNLGFGLDFGIRANPLLDVVVGLEHSSHSGGANGMTLTGVPLSAVLHFAQIEDFDLSVIGGPGFYFYNAAVSQTYFGLQIGAAGDVVIEDSLRVGIAWRYNQIFGGTPDQGSYWTIMARVGVYIDLGN